MIIYEHLQCKNIDELTDWIVKNWNFDSAPHWRWWDENYCKRCETVVACIPEFGEDEHEFAYCEVNHNCRYFKEMKDIPDDKMVVKMWLESEC